MLTRTSDSGAALQFRVRALISATENEAKVH